MNYSITKAFKAFFKWFLNTLELQFFLTLICWPIFLVWGIPVPCLTIIGNIIFTPFLLAALALSCLITICTLCCIPDSIFVWLFESVLQLWQSLLNIPFSHGYIIRATPAWYWLLLVALSSVLILKLRKQSHRIVGFLTAWCLWNTLFWFLQPSSYLQVHTIGSHSVLIMKEKKGCLIIEPGKRRIRHNDALLKRTFVPLWYQKLGTQPIDKVVCLHTSNSVNNYYQSLQKHLTIGQVEVPAD